MYDAADLARDSGVNLAFFGSNAVYWRIKFEDSANGVPHRVMVAYKNPALDPETVRWRGLGHAEQALIGVQYGAYAPDTLGNTDYIVKNSNHWVYENAGVSDNDSGSLHRAPCPGVGRSTSWAIAMQVYAELRSIS